MSPAFYYLILLFGLYGSKKEKWTIPKKQLTEKELRGCMDYYFRVDVNQEEIDHAVQELMEAGAVTDEGAYYRICDDVRAMYIPKNKPHWWSLSWDDGIWDYFDALRARFENP